MARGRRPNGDGTIGQRKSDGLWYAQVSLDNGKRKTIYGHTQREVREKLTQMNRDRDRGLNVAPERQTVESYLTSWLAGRRTTVRESTWVRDEYAVRGYLIAEFGGLTLAKLTQQPARIQATYARWVQEHDVAPSTVRRVHAVLHTALRDAERRGYVPINVATRVELPRVTRQEMRVWDTSQVNTFLVACQGEDRLGPLMALAVLTGMRQGELLALRWADVDLTCGSISVRYNRVRRIDGWEDSEPKTRAGTRTFTIRETALAVLKDQRRRQAAERLKAGKLWRDHDLVFTSEVGTHLSANSVLKHYLTFAARLGLPRIRFHDLRHTAATMALQAGVPVNDVSAMLGHASVSITLNVYGHATPGAALAAAGIERALEAARTSGAL